MLQIDSHVWNQIAPLAKSPVWRRRMEMNNEQLATEMDSLGDRLEAAGNEPPVGLAYEQVAPLLQERKAIQSFLRTNPQYSQALPEVLSPNEAIMLMIKEHHLTASQTRMLRTLLAQTPPP